MRTEISSAGNPIPIIEWADIDLSDNNTSVYVRFEIAGHQYHGRLRKSGSEQLKWEIDLADVIPTEAPNIVQLEWTGKAGRIIIDPEIMTEIGKLHIQITERTYPRQ